MPIPTPEDGEAVALHDAAAIIHSTEELTAAALAAEPLGDQYPDVIRTVIPDGWTQDITDLEEYAETPRRKRGIVALQTTESLARYINDQRTPGTIVYANPTSLQIVAVLDDHVPSRTDADAPGHRDHRATLTLQRTPGCKRWFDAHGKYLDQEAFAQMVEDGLTEIARPSGAELLELATTIQSTMTAEFRSSIRLPTGQTQISYVENGTTKAGATGQMEIPETITLVIEPFFGAQPIQIEARLRFRIRAGQLVLGVWLIRGEEELRAAFQTEIDRLASMTMETGIDGEGVVTLIGTP